MVNGSNWIVEVAQEAVRRIRWETLGESIFTEGDTTGRITRKRREKVKAFYVSAGACKAGFEILTHEAGIENNSG